MGSVHETICLNIETSLTDSNEVILFEHVGRTLYQVKGLQDAYGEDSDSFDLPFNLLVMLYSMAYSHSRALLASELSPTPYKEKFFLPIVDPKKLIEGKSQEQ